MVTQVHDTSCRSCGAVADIGQTKCLYCKQPILISTFNSVYSMPMPMVNQYAVTYREALQSEPDAKDLNNMNAMCLLKLGLHEDAYDAFKQAFKGYFDNPESAFYAAICLLGGKKAFLCSRDKINEIEKLIKAALAIEPKGIYHYFWAYIKYDFFERKSLNTSPNYREALEKASAAGVSPHDVEQLFGILGVSRPEVM